MSAYMIIQAEVTDRDAFRAYAETTAALVRRFGGQYVVRGAPPENLEGDWLPGVTVVSTWPSVEQARAFWQSPEYQEAKKLRENCCTARVVLVPGLEPEASGDG